MVSKYQKCLSLEGMSNAFCFNIFVVTEFSLRYTRLNHLKEIISMHQNDVTKILSLPNVSKQMTFKRTFLKYYYNYYYFYYFY